MLESQVFFFDFPGVRVDLHPAGLLGEFVLQLDDDLLEFVDFVFVLADAARVFGDELADLLLVDFFCLSLSSARDRSFEVSSRMEKQNYDACISNLMRKLEHTQEYLDREKAENKKLKSRLR